MFRRRRSSARSLSGIGWRSGETTAGCQAFRIVGEDEADPRNGSISYVSPVARALIGKAAGDVVLAGDHEIEILSIE